MKTIDYQVDKDGIVILTLDVKDKPMNVMTPEFQLEVQHPSLGMIPSWLMRLKGMLLWARTVIFRVKTGMSEVVPLRWTACQRS